MCINWICQNKSELDLLLYAWFLRTKSPLEFMLSCCVFTMLFCSVKSGEMFALKLMIFLNVLAFVFIQFMYAYSDFMFIISVHISYYLFISLGWLSSRSSHGWVDGDAA